MSYIQYFLYLNQQVELHQVMVCVNVFVRLIFKGRFLFFFSQMHIPWRKKTCCKCYWIFLFFFFTLCTYGCSGVPSHHIVFIRSCIFLYCYFWNIAVAMWITAVCLHGGIHAPNSQNYSTHSVSFDTVMDWLYTHIFVTLCSQHSCLSSEK